ncbi:MULTISPECIES: cupredoxin family protein [Thiomonas]|jgi:uncharacterized cupredoxin-like copper-binding protein|uniref:Putative blue (Type 1) copper domain protein, oxido-reductase protein involved in Cu(II)/Cu(I) resistance (CopI) n=1 Tax=Thiomonas delicata TaxID=364030 RepID=A0A238D7E0_THIDL|nr:MULTISPECIES: cupredoxin family protein [Thiomonas]SBP89139.1 putative blue (Type 1) copper domain protein, oxido-reductase protein involved in Cu(II)/Cu(I) resistance (CopI) [Thiomonas delicata]
MKMKKIRLSILLLGAWPVFALAATNTSGVENRSHEAMPKPGASVSSEAAAMPGAMKGMNMQGMNMSGVATSAASAPHASVHADADASSVGNPGQATDATKNVEITMDDSMRFTPDVIHVQPGQTIRFVLVNRGHLKHEMTIGSMAELKEHEKMMAAMPDMPDGAEPNMVAVPPGGKGELIWRFGKPGTVDFACTMPGHMEAGMVGKILVE